MVSGSAVATRQPIYSHGASMVATYLPSLLSIACTELVSPYSSFHQKYHMPLLKSISQSSGTVVVMV